MNEEQTVGIITRVYPLTETSLIFHCLTRDCGRIGLAAKGARKPKSPFTGKIDLYYKVEMSFRRSPSSGLHHLRELRLMEPNEHLRRDLALLKQATYVSKLVELATETDSPLDDIYLRMEQFLQELKRPSPQAESVVGMEYDLLEMLGLSPSMEQSRLGAAARKFLTETKAREEKLTPGEFAEINRFTRSLIALQFGKIPAGRDAALLF